VSTINVEVREQSGKGVARKLRAAGRIPAVLYGQGHEPVALALEPRGLEKLLHAEGHNALFDLAGAEAVQGRTVLVKDLQRHPVRGDLMHADLFEIDARKTITISVGIHLVGTPVGVSIDGGLVDHSLREVELDCLPRAIPESIDVDISQMHLGDTLHVSDLPLPEGVEMRTAAELGVVSIVAPRVEEAAGEEEGVEGAEAAAAAPGESEDEGADEGSSEG
jgi:large subunit ribosomal protein L25